MRKDLAAFLSRESVTLVIMSMVSWAVVATLGGCAGGSRGTGSYGLGGVRPVYINEEPSKKEKRTSTKSRAKTLAPPIPTPGLSK